MWRIVGFAPQGPFPKEAAAASEHALARIDRGTQDGVPRRFPDTA